ncbi:MAG TPA: hypothetical protein VKQ08_03835 [Cyclobacteriaceae bacterium]|nr:hypothetical protein [Cyclobacteriaceae bacterium]
MKKSLLFFILGFSFSAITSFKVRSDEYDIATIYKGIDAKVDTKAITRDDDVVNVETLLVPTNLKQGKYRVEVTRKGDDLYQISGTEIYLETRLCLELATLESVTVIIESNYGYTKGKIIFNE